jgi:hypothetical protein
MTQSEMPQFLVLFHHPQEGPDPSPEEMEKIMGQWMTWIRGMNSAGQLVGTNRLHEGGKVLRKAGGAQISDGPYAEAKEVIGGYVLIRADNLDEAVEIARGCPGLNMETTVEVRPVEPLPPI